MAAQGDIERARITELRERELERFRSARPRSLAALERAKAHMPGGVPMAWMASDNDQPVYIAHGSGPGFTDIDGFAYVDFNASDMAMFCGHAHPAMVQTVGEQAARSTQFLLPTEDSIEVAEELARRYHLSHWQFTLAATQANMEAIRLARAVTGRDVVLLFHGHYHGHFEEGLVDLRDGRPSQVQRGLARGVTGRVRVAEFNDVDMLEHALKTEEVAIVLTEPAMTNYVHMLLPDEQWHTQLRERTRAYGTLLAIDETHTHVVAPGGATQRFGLAPDIITIGKAVAGGIPLGAYGVTPTLASAISVGRNVATGGTLFGNALSAAAARTALREILTPEAYAHTSKLGVVLADGIDAAIAAANLPWKAIRFGPRSGQWFGPQPRTGREALDLADEELTRLMRIWLANRGIWEALPGAGPTVPIPAERADVERYVDAYTELLVELAG